MDQAKKKENFKRLAEKRTQTIIDNIRILTNLSNLNNYDYEKEDVDKIFKAIEESLKAAKKEFNKELNNNKFKL